MAKIDQAEVQEFGWCVDYRLLGEALISAAFNLDRALGDEVLVA